MALPTVDNGQTGLAFRNVINSNFDNLDGRETATDANVSSLDVRVTALEDSHTLLLVATSTALSQEPTLVDAPIQVEFGPLQTTTDIDISAAGAITFKTAGKYIISPFFQYGRLGSSGVSILLSRYLVNGVQSGETLGATIDNGSTLVPWSSSIQFTAATNDVLTIEVMRDSNGVNAGGLFAIDPVDAGWTLSPCASIQIYKAT